MAKHMDVETRASYDDEDEDEDENNDDDGDEDEVVFVLLYWFRVVC